jgi:hypothetical protein
MARVRKRKNNATTGEKKFVCHNESCERSFTRAEHLQRHLLNHSTGEYTCARCRAHFKRRDLLGKVPCALLQEWAAAFKTGLHVRPPLFCIQKWIYQACCHLSIPCPCYPGQSALSRSSNMQANSMETGTWHAIDRKTKRLVLLVVVC